MLDLFAAAPKALRRERLQEYDAFLLERDGEMNLTDMTLSKRETSVQRFETPPSAVRELDVAQFRRHYASFDRRTPPGDEVTLLLTLVKANAAEAYGVSRAFQRAMERALKNGDNCELRLLCEEGYHTRILLSAAKLYDIEIDQPYTPPSALRVLIGGIANLPMVVARPLTLAGEILATIMFINLIGVTRRVLKHKPELRDAIEERLSEICIDERGHISYNRLQMSSAALAETRLILPTVAHAMATAMPELVSLGGYPSDVLSALPLIADPRRMPECVRRHAFVA